MERSALELAKRLQAIIDTAIDSILTIDHRGRIETLNRAACELFEYQAEEVMGRNVKMLMPEPYHSEHDGYMDRYTRTKERRIIGIGREVSGRKKSGATFPMRLAVSEVVLNDRVIFTGIIQDISAIKKAQAEIIELNKQLESKVSERTYELESVVNQLLKTNTTLETEINERLVIESELKNREEELEEALNKEKELNELKSRFVSMASHEFRTPLASILSSAALIGRYEKEEQQPNREKHIDRIKSAVVNLTGILNDFLSLGKLEEGRVEISNNLIDLSNLCDAIVAETKGLMKPSQEIVHKTYGNSKEVYIDERILRNILFNLTSNAVKYSEKNIYCDIHFNENNFEIKIRDQGIGIPVEDQKHMFTRFFRASNVTNIQGTGLGLNIVKRYVDLLNGDISFESEHEVGTTFTVTLPYNNQNTSL